MNKTTYNLTPEEKLSVYGSKYQGIEPSNPELQTFDMQAPQLDIPFAEAQPVEEIKKEVVQPTTQKPIVPHKSTEDVESKEETEPRMSSLMYGTLDRVFRGAMPIIYIKAHDGTLGTYKDKPDPQTVQYNVLRRAQGYKPNKMSQEIESTKMSNDDKRYCKLLQYLESGSNYKVVNDAGFMGLYQFGPSALKAVKMNRDDYMQSSVNQHLAAIRLKNLNLEKSGLNQYVGKVIGGIKMTANGLAAGQHLGGAGSVKKFCESNGKLVQIDGNNLPITAYLSIFS